MSQIEIQLEQQAGGYGNEHRGFLDIRQGDLAIRVLETEVIVVNEEDLLPAAHSDVLEIKAEQLRCRISLSLLVGDSALRVLAGELPAIDVKLQAHGSMSVPCRPCVELGAASMSVPWVAVNVSGESGVALGPMSCGQGEVVNATCKYSFTDDDQDSQLSKTVDCQNLLVVALRKRLRLKVAADLRNSGNRRCDIRISISGDLCLAPWYVRADSSELETLRTTAKYHLSQEDYKQALTNLKASLVLQQHAPKTLELSALPPQELAENDIIHQCVGDARTAITWWQEALALKEKKLGTSMPDAAGTLLNLGDDYMKVREYDKAVEHYQRGLALFSSLDPKGADTALALHRMATALELHGSLGQALEAYSESLSIRTNLHPRIFADQLIADSLCGIASVHVQLGENEKAREMYSKALKLRERSSGPESRETAATLMDLGIIYLRTGSKQWALDSFRRAFAIYQQTFGPNHAKTATALHQLGMVHSSLGQYQYAMGYYSRALRIRDSDESLRAEAAATINNIGVALSQMGEFQQACTYHQRAYNIQKNVLGTEHPDTIATFTNLQMANQAWQRGQAARQDSAKSPWLPTCECCKDDAKDTERALAYLNSYPILVDSYSEEVCEGSPRAM